MDPPGAALGGYILHQAGQLQEKQGWVENLARDFQWLPDGRILLAALLRRDSSSAEQNRGLGLLLSATENRPLFTDGLSLGMELLRRWPDEASRGQRFERLDYLAGLSAGTDWGAFNLTVWPDILRS